MKTTFIYILFDPRLESNKCYVGKSDNPILRLSQHLRKINRKTKKVDWIRGLKKLNLTPELFIADEVNINEWIFWERYWITQMKVWGFNLVNGTEGGDGGNTYALLTDEQKIKFKQKLSNKMTIIMTGKPKTESHRKKISEVQFGRKQSAESSKLKSIALKGRPSPNKGNKLTDESKERLANGHKKIVLALDENLRIMMSGHGYDDLANKLNANKNYVSNCRRNKTLFRKQYWIVLEKDFTDFVVTHAATEPASTI